jgi:hypothetical protein
VKRILASVNEIGPNASHPRLVRQGWISLAIWIAFGILIEGMSAFRTPAFLDDPLRREMLRLAHAHGTLLNLVLLVAVICARLEIIVLRRASSISLSLAVIFVPIGFLLGGLWHYPDDPGLGIFLVPAGALLLLFAAVSVCLSIINSDK